MAATDTNKKISFWNSSYVPLFFSLRAIFTNVGTYKPEIKLCSEPDKPMFSLLPHETAVNVQLSQLSVFFSMLFPLLSLPFTYSSRYSRLIWHLSWWLQLFFFVWRIYLYFVLSLLLSIFTLWFPSKNEFCNNLWA